MAAKAWTREELGEKKWPGFKDDYALLLRGGGKRGENNQRELREEGRNFLTKQQGDIKNQGDEMR